MKEHGTFVSFEIKLLKTIFQTFIQKTKTFKKYKNLKQNSFQ